MKYSVYCMKDKVNGFMTPTLDMNDVSAVRNFEAAVINQNGLMYTHTDDFDLYKLGVFDTQSGQIETSDVPELVVSGSSLAVVKEKNANEI